MKIWQVLNNSQKNLLDILLENRGLKTKNQKTGFFKPTNPQDLSLKDLDISKKQILTAVKRLQLAQKNKEQVLVYGDYDADGVTATAILWETLYKLGLNVMPYIPDRFDDGYGIRFTTVEKLKKTNEKLRLIITVDNGIVAHEEIKKISNLGIDVIITDHHLPDKKQPKAHAIIHTTQICGSALAWIFSREVTKSFKHSAPSGLELAGIGTIADQMPLVNANRSFAKFGLEELNKTKRKGLIDLIRDSGAALGNIGTYEINYIVAPRINAMGRLKSGMDSLRLLCTKDAKRAGDLARLVSKTNLERQEIVDKTLLHAHDLVKVKSQKTYIIFVESENYHEGVIGLAAGKLVEEFYKPAIVVSKGEKLSKGSARSIAGFNIIEAIRANQELLIAHGGHVMAAGFTIETAKLSIFQEKLNNYAKKYLTQDLLTRKLRIDCELDFKSIDWKLVDKIKDFEPTGLGNPAPTFVTYGVEVSEVKKLGKDKNHLKLKLKKDNKYFEVTTFRTESEYEDARHPTKIKWGKTLEEDLQRRDFTINAMALKPNQIMDPYKGQQDIKNRIIKAVGDANERFSEDALRMMRAIRIAAQLNFKIDETTFDAIKANVKLINKISKERIKEELFKILASPHAYEGIKMLFESGLMEEILPEVYKMFGVEQKSPGRHHIYDVGTHCLMALKYCESPDPVTRLATLIHDIGKPATFKKLDTGTITFYNHEVVGARIASNIADRLKFSRKEKEKLITLVRFHQFTVNESQTDSAIRRFIRNVGIAYIEDMLLLRKADRLGSGAKETSWRTEDFKKRIIEVQKQPFSIKDLKINGNDVMKELNLKPGPKIGEILETVFKEVEEKRIENERKILLEKVKALKI